MPNRPLTPIQLPEVQFNPAGAVQDMARLQVSQTALQEARRKSMARMRMQQLAQQYPDDPQQFLSAFSKEFPEEGYELEKGYQEKVKEGALAHKAQAESSLASLGLGTRLLQAAVENPTLYPAVKDWITKVSPELGERMAPEYDEATAKGYLQIGQSTENFLKAQADAAQLLVDGKTRESVLTLFAHASDPHQWQVAADLTKQAGLTKLLGLVPPEWSAEAQAAAGKATITPYQQAQLDKPGAAGAEGYAQWFARYLARKGKTAEQLTQAEEDAAKKQFERLNDQPKVSVSLGGAGTGGLVDAVIANPSLWDDLTPTVKGQIAPALQAKGFEGFGKALPSAAIKQISDSKTAIDSLNDLRQVLKDNEQYIGPIAGLQALYPYSDARKAQARIDLVRQRVGKALEGGVLRKEDEEKYKKILSTLTDEPSTAIYKVDALIHSIEQDVQNFVTQQRLSGRRVTTAQQESVGTGGAKTQKWERGPDGKPRPVK
jgi:hypothetical protein